MSSQSPKEADFKPYEDQDSQEQDVLNVSASTSDTNGTPNRSNKSDKKPTRDRIAHRNFEKFRRDRLKISLEKLKSLIPEEFLKKGASRVDKIKLIDSSCNYIENLKNRVSKLEEHKSVSSKSTAQPLNKIEQDQWYIKGLFNGSIELIVFLIDGIKGRAATLSNFIRLTKLFIRTLREFHDVYFKTHGSSELKICDFLSYEENKRSFPLRNSRLKRKVFEMLDSESEMPLEFFEEMMTQSSSKQNWASAAENLVESDMENASDSQSDDSDDADSYRSNRNLDEKTEISFKSSSSSNKSTRENSKGFKNHQNIPKYSSAKSVGSSSNESFQGGYLPHHKSQSMRKDDASSSSSQKAKKIKSHYIERYISHENQSGSPSKSIKRPTNEMAISLYSPDDGGSIGGRYSQATQDDAKMVSPSKPHVDQSIRSNSSDTLRTSDESLSIFILHASQDFYFGGLVDKSLINKSILNNFVCNRNYRPISLHKVKVDVDFNQEIIVA